MNPRTVRPPPPLAPLLCLRPPQRERKGLLWFVAFALLATANALHGAVFPTANELKTMSLDELLDVQVISASRTLEDWRTAPTAISVLTSEDVRRSGAVRLADVLRLAPGIHVGRNVGGGYAIGARGFSSSVGNKMEVLLDGRSLYTPLFAGVSWNLQDTLLADVSRIETVRGPGATLWGANAVNGVINIVTKSADETPGLLVTGGAGTEEQVFAGARYGGKLGRDTYYRVYLKHVERDSLIFSDGTDAQDDLEQSQAGFRIDSFLTASDALSIIGDVYFNDAHRANTPEHRNDGASLLGRWNRGFELDSELQVQAYYEWTIRDVPALFYEDRSTLAAEAQYHFGVGDRHRIVVGGNYRWTSDQTGSGDPYAFVPKDRSLTLVGGFVQDEIALLPEKLTLYVGSKFEHNDFTGLEFQPSMRVAFRPSIEHTLWASVSRAVRTPTRAERDAVFVLSPFSSTTLFRGDKSFDSEDLVAFEFGYRMQPHENLFVDVATFFNSYDNLRTFSETAPGARPLILTNGREGDTYGGEVVVTWQTSSWWRMMGSYAYFEEDLHFKRGVVDPTGGLFETNDAQQTVKLHLTMNLRPDVELDFFARYVDELPNPHVPDYVELDVRFAWKPSPSLELALVLRDLLDESHPEFRNTATYVEVERSGYVQATWQF